MIWHITKNQEYRDSYYLLFHVQSNKGIKIKKESSLEKITFKNAKHLNTKKDN